MVATCPLNRMARDRLAMTLDHLSFGTHDISATRSFYEGKLGFPVLIHERMLMREGRLTRGGAGIEHPAAVERGGPFIRGPWPSF